MDVAYKILIVDDHPIFRQGLIALLEDEEDLQVCGEASEPGEALKLLNQFHPDLITLDINLKSGSGLQLLKQIRAHDKKVKILVTSMHDELLFAERCIHGGANGYINKEETANKIDDAIHKILQGGLYLSNRMMMHLSQSKLQGNHATTSTPDALLSNRELEVFMLIGKGLSTQAIADGLHLSSKTIDTHKENIKRKLNIRDNTALIQKAVAWTLEETTNS